MDVKFALEEYGLTDKESKVYLALLPLGEINLQEIAKKVNLPRSTIYNTLNYLSNKGLVSKIKKKSVTFFKATEPTKFIDSLENKKRLLNSIMPELEILQKSKVDVSSAEIYEGSKGLFTILSDVFKTKQEVCYFGSYSLSVGVLKHQPDHFRTIRLDKKIPARVIIETYNEKTFHSNEYKKLTRMRFLDSMKDFPCMIFIYGNSVAIYTLKGNLIGVIIRNKEVANAIKFIFETYWKIGKEAKL